MMLPGLFSILFFFAFSVYMVFGAYTFLLNPGSAVNRIFFMLCMSLSVWACCYAFANVAPDPASAVLWRRLSALGWGSLYAILLQFTLVLTDHPILRRIRLLQVLLYVPALVTIYLFAYHGSPASLVYRYDMVLEPLGWVNRETNALDWVFNIYFLSYNLLSAYFLFKWGFLSKDRSKRHLVRVLFGAFAVALVFGTLTDLVINTHTSHRVPQLASVFTLLPVLAMYFIINRFGLMKAPERRFSEPGRILGIERQAGFYRLIALLFIFAGCLQFSIRYFGFGRPMNEVAPFSLVLVLYGLLLSLLPLLSRHGNLQDLLFSFLMISFTPALGILYLMEGNDSVWLFPFVLPLLSVLFNRRWMLWGIGSSILLTHLFLWQRVPELTLQLSGMGRLVLVIGYVILLLLAGYVNKAYVWRLRVNEEQLRFQQLVASLSLEFSTGDAEAMDEKIHRMLAKCGIQYEVDRAVLILFRDGWRTFAWHRKDGSMESRQAISVPKELVWLRKQLERQEVLVISDVESIPADAEPEKEWMRENSIRALLASPVKFRGEVSGYLAFFSDNDPRQWREEHADLLMIASNLLSDTLSKVTADEEIHALAHYDGLTGLPNRQSILSRLEQQIRSIRREDAGLAVMLLDLDAFKTVNDMMGHSGGDELLKEVAVRLKGCLRWQDTLSRIGGDEFMILISPADKEEEIHATARKVVETFVRPVTVQGRDFFVTASVGVALYPMDGDEADILVKNAEMAMYAAKSAGKNQYSLCSAALKHQIQRQTILTNDLHRALARGQLQILYQPQVVPGSGLIVGMEALLRWNHPDFGMISPDVFIPIAEKTGLIHRIGQWVLKESCILNRAWQDEGLSPVRMAVNLSVEQFRDPNLVGMVGGVLEETGLESMWLELEITESVASGEMDRAIEILKSFKTLGVQIAIDDFGTEYSSLSRLKILPVDRLKLDMMFVHGIGRDQRDEAVATTIIRLAKDLRLHTIAEGVETLEQEHFLMRVGCEEIQGYLHHRPMPPAEARALLISQQVQYNIDNLQ